LPARICASSVEYDIVTCVTGRGNTKIFQSSKITMVTIHHIHTVRWSGGFGEPGGCGAGWAMFLRHFSPAPAQCSSRSSCKATGDGAEYPAYLLMGSAP
jgi:hypothetical protein